MTSKDASISRKGEEKNVIQTKTPLKQVVGWEALNPQPLTIQGLEPSNDDDLLESEGDAKRLRRQLAKFQEANTPNGKHARTTGPSNDSSINVDKGARSRVP
ncbi:unnamed protein product [Linum trigynum]|uniref:Uncharacterized protein n=1 Tax=Linum trigynum TaxID=586398 RepID=A0AAV2GMH7_9ROSI